MLTTAQSDEVLATIRLLHQLTTVLVEQRRTTTLTLSLTEAAALRSSVDRIERRDESVARMLLSARPPFRTTHSAAEIVSQLDWAATDTDDLLIRRLSRDRPPVARIAAPL